MTANVSHLPFSTNVQVGARLRLFACNWGKLTSDPWVLRTVSEGYTIEFTREPKQAQVKSDIQQVNPAEIKIFDTEVSKMLAKGAVRTKTKFPL